MSETYIHPGPDQITRLRAMQLDGPVVMLNLLRFRPEGGEEAYTAYGAAAATHLERSGASVRYLGRVEATVIGGETWDQIVLVEYPSVRAFLDMSSADDYPGELRAQALLDSRLYCTQDLR